MTTNETAAIVTDSIRQAAKECDCTPKQAHMPAVNTRAAMAARNIAIRLAHDAGVKTNVLCDAFQRSRGTIENALRMSVAD